jgi:uncharacterized repeat protein (TIGR03803 family)
MKFVSHSSCITMTGWRRRTVSASARLVSTATVLCALVTAVVVTAPAQTYTTIYSFTGSSAEPASPNSPLVQGTNGDFYGTSVKGGGSLKGTVFRITPADRVTTLYSFCGQDECGKNNGAPLGLIQATNGNFYGVGRSGSANGSVFEITPSGSLTTVYNFCSQSNCADGDIPNGVLLQGLDGNFYGTTQAGGTNNAGTIYKLTATGSLTTLYNFCSLASCTDGSSPLDGVIQDAGGNLYGTTYSGGDNACGGCGTAFKLSPSGVLTTLYTFCSLSECADGSFPETPLTMGSDGNLYGTTTGGATTLGTAFKLTPAGTLTTLHTFCAQAGCPDGILPSNLIQATDGNFYGGTFEHVGGSGEGGAIFQITPQGGFTILYSSRVHNVASLIQGTNGMFYGTSTNGGSYGEGSIFTLTLSKKLGPFVETQTRGAKVGSSVVTLGTNLTGATSVTFDGSPDRISAEFKVVSASEIEATVPSGAITGTIQVTTPNRTLTSDTSFEVVPSGEYHLQNVNSGLYVGVAGASTEEGADLVQWDSNGSPDQEWIVTMVGNGVYQIEDVNSKLLVGVASASKEEHASVVQWEANGSPDQKWQFIPSGSNWLITDVNSGMQMAIDGNFVNEGASVIQWPANGTTSQLFTLIPVQ